MKNKNKTLKTLYNQVYRKGEQNHFTPNILLNEKLREDRSAVLAAVDWRGKRVIDAGCGTGELPFLIAKKGALNVLGIDYSEETISIAKKTYSHPKLSFKIGVIDEIKGTFDIITCMGTLEHMNNPFLTLKLFKEHLAPGGSILITCPNWVNPRGYMLQLLYHLFNARITLADLHYLTPIELEAWAKKLRLNLQWNTVYHDWGNGEMLIEDFRRRLPNVLGELPVTVDASQIESFIQWLDEHMVPFETQREKSKFGGTTAIYHLKKAV